MVDFYELDGSPTEEWGTDGYFRAKRRLMCAWSDRYTLLGEAATGSIRLYPYNKPVRAYAVGATVLPFGDNPQVGLQADEISYDTAIVTVTYAFQPYEPRPISNFMVTEELHPYTEYQLLPAEGLHVGSAGGANPTKDQSVLTGGMEYILSFYDLAAAPAAGLDMLYNCNVGVWSTYLLGIFFNPKRMLLTSVAPRVDVRLGLSGKTQLHYAFKTRSKPWDQRLTENGWETIYNDAGDPIVATSNFNLLRP